MVEDIQFTIKYKEEKPSPIEKDRKEDKAFADFQKRVEKERKVEQRGIERERKKRERDARKRGQGRRAALAGGIGTGAGAIRNPAGLVTGAATGILTKLLGPAAAAFVIFEVGKYVAERYFGPGGPGDRRLRIIIAEQFNALVNRQESADRQLGRKVVRSTTGRIRGGIGVEDSSLARIRRGGRLELDITQDTATKNIY